MTMDQSTLIARDEILRLREEMYLLHRECGLRDIMYGAMRDENIRLREGFTRILDSSGDIHEIYDIVREMLEG